MRAFPVILALSAAVLFGQSTTQTTLQNPPSDADRVVLVTLGIGDRSEVRWDGSVSVSNGELVDLVGYEMGAGDLIRPPRSWEVSTRPAFPFSRRNHDENILVDLPPETYLTPRFYLYLNGSGATRVSIATEQGDFDFRLNEIPVAGSETFLDGRASVSDSAHAALVGRGDTGPRDRRLTDNDYPSMTVASDGALWVAWQGFEGQQAQADRIYAERIPRGGPAPSSAPHAISPEGGDVYRSAVAEDSEGKIWVVWSERVADNWDLYARSFDGQSWSRIERLTRASQPDAQHRLVAAADGTLHLVWQAFRGSTAGILHKSFHADRGWSEEEPISAEDAPNCWEPSAAVDSDGNLWVAWDQYGPNGYDVHLRGQSGGRWQAPVVAAGTARFEAYPTVAVDRDDRVWLAWHESGVNWGKDWGYPFDITANATGLYQSREIRMAVYDDGRLRSPAQLADALPDPGPGNNFFEYPRLAVDGGGRVWCFFRHRRPAQHNVYSRTPSHHALWEIYGSFLLGDRWSAPILVPYSTGRNDMRIETAPAEDGGLVAVWPTDRRNFRDFVNILPDVFAARFAPPSGEAPSPSLTAFSLPPVEPAPQPPNRPARQMSADEPVHPNEAEDVSRIRGYAYEVGDKRYRIFRGDMHRHTDISWDGYNDGSPEDTYRYALDAASLDFLAITEHNFGVDDEYDWWRSNKFTDVYRVGRSFVPLIGYERSIKYPNGHRNVVFSYRGAPILDYQHYEWNSGEPNFAYTRQGPERFFGYLRKYKAIAMPHTTGTTMGTDWADYDPEVEPIVEIYQSDRTSYECTDCWRAAPPDNIVEQFGGYKPEGYVNIAWDKGYRLGVQASSDHLGVHTAYSMILAEENTRDNLVDAIRARRTYGATDNIIIDFRLVDGDREYMMGEDAEVSGPPTFKVHVEGTDLLGDVEIVKNNRRVFAQQPDRKVADFTYRDNETPDAEQASFFYVRVRQKDRDQQIGWSSPIWVTER